MRPRGLVAAAALLALAPGAVTAAGSSDIRAQPLVLRGVHIQNSAFGEPSIVLDSQDHVYFCGPLGIPGGQIGFIRSTDWIRFSRTTITDRGGGGDCDLEVGPDDSVYVANLQGFASAVRRSTDGGLSFSEASEDLFPQDRQWLAIDPLEPNVVYMAYHLFVGVFGGPGTIVVARSEDHGRTWLMHTVASVDPALAVSSATRTIPGPIRIDPTDHRRLYMVWAAPFVTDCADDPVACAGPNTRAIVVARSDDAGLTWTNHVAIETVPGDALPAFIPWIAVDRDGGVHVAAAGRLGGTNGLYLTSSDDRGETWTGQRKVDPGTGAVAFPTVIAGLGGMVDLAWISSTAESADDTTGEWSVWFAQTRDAFASEPAFETVQGPVIHQGDVCLRGLLCLPGTDRTLLDFMDMALDSFGYAHMAVASTIPIPHVLYWRQDAGPSLYSEPCAADGDPDCVTVRPRPR